MKVIKLFYENHDIENNLVVINFDKRKHIIKCANVIAAAYFKHVSIYIFECTTL